MRPQEQQQIPFGDDKQERQEQQQRQQQQQQQQQIPFGDDNKRSNSKGNDRQQQIPPLRCGMTSKKDDRRLSELVEGLGVVVEDHVG